MVAHIGKSKPRPDANRSATCCKQYCLRYAPSATSRKRGACFHPLHAQIDAIRIITNGITDGVKQTCGSLDLRLGVTHVYSNKLCNPGIIRLNRTRGSAVLVKVHLDSSLPEDLRLIHVSKAFMLCV